MQNAGGSIMNIAKKAGAESQPADTGMQMGRALYDADLSARQRYEEPAKFSVDRLDAGVVAPNWFNNTAAPPVKYSVPTAMKDRMVAREAIRLAAKTNGADRPDPITDEEVSYLQAMQDQAELADFDRYVNKLIDVKRPGMMKVMMDIYPEFVERRIKQVHTDYEYALRKQMIDTWGIQTFDDLHFLYLNDQGKIKGPKLTDNGGKTPYETGMLSPFAFVNRRNDVELKAPYSSTSEQQGGIQGTGVFENTDQPFQNARNVFQMAGAMYDPAVSV